MKLKYKNFAKSFLSVAINSAATNIILGATDGLKFPALIPGQEEFYVTLKDSAETKFEICKVTGVSGDILTVERGVDDSIAQSWAQNDLVELCVVSAILPDQYLNTTSDPTFTGVQLNTTAPAAGEVGKIVWNDTDGCPEVMLKGGNSTLQIGQETVLRCVNKSGSTVLNGTVVYISGVQGNRPTIAFAQANADITSNNTIGVVTENIENNNEGFVTLHGLVRDLNTSAWPEGTTLFLSPTVAGGITSTHPHAPNHTVRLGWVVRQHAVNGSILVNVLNGFDIDELHDVHVTNPLNGQVLRYVTANSRWENATAGSAVNYDAGNASGNVPLNNGTVNTNLNADKLDGFDASAFVRTIQGVAPDASGNVVVDLASKVSKSGDTMSGILTAPQLNITSTAPVLAMADTDWGTRYLHHQNGIMGFLDSSGNWAMYENNGGLVWTKNYGWLHERFAAASHSHSITSAGGTSLAYSGLTIKGLTAGSGISLSSNPTSIVISYNAGGSGACLHQHTLVKTEFGQKFICDIRPGDKIVTPTGIDKVIGVWESVIGDRNFFEINNSLVLTPGHLIKTNNGWAVCSKEEYTYNDFNKEYFVKSLNGFISIKSGNIEPENINEINEHAMLINSENELTKVNSIRTIKINQQHLPVYSIALENQTEFYADGYLVASLSV